MRVMVERADGVIGEDIMRTAIYGCSEFFDWLLDFPHTREYYTVEKLGDKREAGPIYGPAVTHFVRRIENVRSLDPSIGPGWAGTFIKQTMLDAIPAQKLNVEILLQHEAKHLIKAGRIGFFLNFYCTRASLDNHIHTFSIQLKVTYDSHLDMIPTLKEEEKAQIYAWLIEYRECRGYYCRHRTSAERLKE